MRVNLEDFRFSFYMHNTTGTIKDCRAELVEVADKNGCEALQLMNDVLASHIRNKPEEI